MYLDNIQIHVPWALWSVWYSVLLCIYKPMPSPGHDILAEKSEKSLEISTHAFILLFFCFRTMKVSCSYLFYFYLIPLLRKYILYSPVYVLLCNFSWGFFTIQHILFYPIPQGEFRFFKDNTHTLWASVL